MHCQWWACKNWIYVLFWHRAIRFRNIYYWESKQIKNPPPSKRLIIFGSSVRGVHCTRITMCVIKTPWGELRTTRWTSELNFRVVSISERRGNERDCIVHLFKLHESTVEKLRALFINLFAIFNFETFVGFFSKMFLLAPIPPQQYSSVFVYLLWFSLPYGPPFVDI